MLDMVFEVKKMKLTKQQLVRIIREEKRNLLRESVSMDEIDLENPSGANGDHHWPRVEWDNIYDLVDKWVKMEEEAFDPGDPSMTSDGELSQ